MKLIASAENIILCGALYISDYLGAASKSGGLDDNWQGEKEPRDDCRTSQLQSLIRAYEKG